MIRELSKPRFEALLYQRQPFAFLIIEELEWWTNEEETLIAIVNRDISDNDYSWVVLGRDETGVYRAIEQKVCIDDQVTARNELVERLKVLSIDNHQKFPQVDNKREKHEILVPCVSNTKLHPHFIYLTEDSFQTGSRGLIKELSFAFKDLDGNFKKDFQTTGFYGRLWELYLYAFLYESRLYINDDISVPDFIVECPTGKIAIEAVTVNPTDGVIPPQPTSPEEESELNKNYMPIKWSSPLYSKLKKRYWDKSEVIDTPLIFAIHDFHGPNSMSWSRPALSDYLFGVQCDAEGNDNPNQSYTFENKTIPSGFFSLPEAENISAVITSSEATLSKFNRMGMIAGFSSQETHIFRNGVLLDLKNTKMLPFSHPIIVGKSTETWASGIWIFHNPNAKKPLDKNVFHRAINVFLINGQRVYHSSERYHVIRSSTNVIMPENDKCKTTD